MFPRLRKLCASHGCRFQAIDLRWGVSEEAALDQQTMNICFAELDRCQRVTPRPNFIVLLGDRYGWIPLPPQIPADEFEEVLQNVSQKDRAYVVFEGEGKFENEPATAQRIGWYHKDENAAPGEYALLPRALNVKPNIAEDELKAAQERESDAWNEVETRLRGILLGAINELGWPKNDCRREKYERSATHQEIDRGALAVPEEREHVFAFFREITNIEDLVATLPSNETASEYLDHDRAGKWEKSAHAQLRALKKELRDLLGVNAWDYEARWENERITNGHLHRLCKRVYESLAGVILGQFEQLKGVDPLTEEIAANKEFGESRASTFIGRAEILSDIGRYVKGTHPEIDTLSPLVIYGPRGSGKSALLAEAALRLKNGSSYWLGDSKSGEKSRDKGPANGKSIVVARFIESTPESTQIELLLRGLCQEIATVMGIPLQDEKSDSNSFGSNPVMESLSKRTPAEEERSQRQRVFGQFRSLLARIPDDKSLVVFVDGLDQLDSSNNAHAMNWLPCDIKKNVRIILTALGGEDAGTCIASAERKMPIGNLRGLPSLDSTSASVLLVKWLDAAKRRLQTLQQEHLLENFKRCGMPLYLRLAFEEAQRWKSFDGLLPRSGKSNGLAADMEGVVRDFLSRLERPENHGKVLVSRSLAYLAAARNGLSEDEVLDKLSDDGEVMADFRRRSPRSPKADRLPVVVWSRLRADLEPHLVQRRAYGALLIGFRHRQIGMAASDRLKTLGNTKIHAELAEYFEKQPDVSGAPAVSARPNSRKWSELPWQLCESDQWTKLSRMLTRLILSPESIFRHKPANPILTEGDFWRYWTQIESATSLRMVESLRPAIDKPAEYEAGVLWSVSHILVARRHLVEARRILSHLADRHRRAGELAELAGILGIFTEICYYDHQMDDALRALDEAEVIYRGMPDRRLLAGCLLHRGHVLESLGHIDEAQRLFEEQEKIFRNYDNDAGVVACLSNRANISLKKSRPDKALELLQECEQLELEMGDELGCARTLYNQAIALHTLGMFPVAKNALLKSERIFRDYGDMEGVSGCLGKRAAVIEDMGRPQDAVLLLEEQAEICERAGYDEGILRARGNLARLWGLVLGDPDRGESLARETLGLAELIKLPYYEEWMKRVLCEIRKRREVS